MSEAWENAPRASFNTSLKPSWDAEFHVSRIHFEDEDSRVGPRLRRGEDLAGMSALDASEFEQRALQIKQDVQEKDRLRRDIALLDTFEASPARPARPVPVRAELPDEGEASFAHVAEPPLSAPRVVAAAVAGADHPASFPSPVLPRRALDRASRPTFDAAFELDSPGLWGGSSAPPLFAALDSTAELFDLPPQSSSPSRSARTSRAFEERRPPSGRFTDPPSNSPFAAAAAQAGVGPLKDGLARDMDRFKYTPRMRSLHAGHKVLAGRAAGPKHAPPAAKMPALPPPEEERDDQEAHLLAARVLNAPLTVLQQITAERKASAPAGSSPAVAAPAGSSPAVAAPAIAVNPPRALRPAENSPSAESQAQEIARLRAQLGQAQSAGSARRARHSLQGAMERMLARGNLFIKITSRGAAHERYVWCDFTRQRLFWALVSNDGLVKESARSLQLKQITRVISGQGTDAFHRHARPGLSSACLSVATPYRTLDLQVVASGNAQEIRDEWLDALTAAALASGARLE